MKFGFSLFALALLSSSTLFASEIPAVYSLIKEDSNGYYIVKDNKKIREWKPSTSLTLDNMIPQVSGDKEGLQLTFADTALEGTLYYGFIHHNDSKHPMPVISKRTSEIVEGKASIKFFDKLDGKLDMVDWERNGFATMGYRVTNAKGAILHDGRFSFNYSKETGFSAANSMFEGPLVHKLGTDSVTLSMRTTINEPVRVTIDGQTYTSEPVNGEHVLNIEGLSADTQYPYAVTLGPQVQNYAIQTPPLPGTRKPFTFAYASDSRGGKGGGERDIHGANAYVLKKILALAG